MSRAARTANRDVSGQSRYNRREDGHLLADEMPLGVDAGRGAAPREPAAKVRKMMNERKTARI